MAHRTSLALLLVALAGCGASGDRLAELDGSRWARPGESCETEFVVLDKDAISFHRGGKISRPFALLKTLPNPKDEDEVLVLLRLEEVADVSVDDLGVELPPDRRFSIMLKFAGDAIVPVGIASDLRTSTLRVGDSLYDRFDVRRC
jgi:hypothetical protein